MTRQGPEGEQHDERAAADAPLHEALDDLESMLRPGTTISALGYRQIPARRMRFADLDPEMPAEPAFDLGESPPAAHTSPAAPDPAGDESPEEEFYRLVAARLASELEIIVNARLEAALERLGEELRHELQNHIEIVLPEIVSALAGDRSPSRRE